MLSLRDLWNIQEEILSRCLETLRVCSSEKSCEVVMWIQEMSALSGNGSLGSGWAVRLRRRLIA